MQRPTAPCGFRFREKASVFLTELHPAAGAQARAEILARLRKRDFDASHHCSAWREAPSAFGADDDEDPEEDGEPGVAADVGNFGAAAPAEAPPARAPTVTTVTTATITAVLILRRLLRIRPPPPAGLPGR